MSKEDKPISTELAYHYPDADKNITNLVGVEVYEPAQYRFLRNFAETLDQNAAMDEAGIKKPTLNAWLRRDGFKREIARINEAFASRLRMTGDEAAMRMLRLADKIEGDYDTAPSYKDKALLASPMVAAATTMMKATGQLERKEQSFGMTVNFNIDFGDDKKEVSVKSDVIDI